MKTRRLRRIRVLVPLVIVAAALATTSTAWACTTFGGQTYINGQTNPPTVAKGAQVPNITGDDVPSTTGWPADNTAWHVSAVLGSGCCYGGTTIATGATLVRNPTAGVPDLGPLTGTAPTYTGRGPQTYQVCYLPNSGALYATSVAYLTVS